MKALFAGSFDPFTKGHFDIVERGLKLFDSIVVAVGYNEHKPGEWSVDERVNAISTLFKGEPKVVVTSYSGLTSEYAKEIGVDVLLRGVRNISDFEYERNLADTNKAVFGVETAFLIASPELSFISSSMVRELLHNGFDAYKYIAGDFPPKLFGSPRVINIKGNPK